MPSTVDFLSLLTWRPVDIGPIRHFVTVAFALSPTVRGYIGAGWRLGAGHEVVWTVGVLQLWGLPRGAQVGT